MSRGTILAIDDEPLFLQALRDTLEDDGFRVVTAENGQKGLDVLMAAPDEFDAILLDRIMPVMDGMEVLRKMRGFRGNVALSTIPVILQTTQSSPKDIQDGIDAGAYYYLTKPWDSETLTTIVRAAVQGYWRVKLADSLLHDYMTSPMRGLHLIEDATFRLQSIEDSKRVAWLISRRAQDQDLVVIGLMEILINAIEHGNLAIGGDRKSILIRENRWEEEIGRLLKLPDNRRKFVTVKFKKEGHTVQVIVEDQGDGFDWDAYECRRFDLDNRAEGHGIMKARQMCFTTLDYTNGGRTVIATFPAVCED